MPNAALQNSGFGLNYNQGFGSRGPSAFGESSFGMASRIGQERYLQDEQQKAARERAQIASNASMYPAQAQMERFRTILPYLTSQFGNLQSMVGGQSGPGPQITAGPIWGDQQIQEQVNAARATGDQATANRISEMQQGVAGRGFGANSPLAQAIAAQYQGQGLAANVAGERETRMSMAERNAQQLLRGQQAAEQQYASRMQEDIERRRNLAGSYNALLGALAGLV